MQRLLSRIRKFFGMYHWHIVLLRCVVLAPFVGMYYIGQAGERVGLWLSHLMPDPRKEG